MKLESMRKIFSFLQKDSFKGRVADKKRRDREIEIFIRWLRVGQAKATSLELYSDLPPGGRKFYSWSHLWGAR